MRAAAAVTIHDSLQNKLSIRYFRPLFKTAVAESAYAIQAGAKRRCPVKTGRLKNSIRVKFYKAGMQAEVGSDLYYSAFVEFGTGQRGASTTPEAPPDPYKYGPRPGMPAQPYLFPACEEEHLKFRARIVDATRIARP